MQGQVHRIEAEQIEPERMEAATIEPEMIDSEPVDSGDDAESSSKLRALNVGRPTEVELVIKARARARIACDLLLARLYRYHPDHAMAHLKGIEPRVVDLEPPTGLEFAVVSAPEQGESHETTAKELRGEPDISLILQKVASFYSTSVADICSSRSTLNIHLPRRVAMYLARTMTRCSLKVIGARMGGRDHTTVHHAIAQVEKAIASDADAKAEVDTIVKQIRALYPRA
jgi:chromosomal replication initiation ATPase DnaA